MGGTRHPLSRLRQKATVRGAHRQQMGRNRRDLAGLALSGVCHPARQTRNRLIHGSPLSSTPGLNRTATNGTHVAPSTSKLAEPPPQCSLRSLGPPVPDVHRISQYYSVVGPSRRYQYEVWCDDQKVGLVSWGKLQFYDRSIFPFATKRTCRNAAVVRRSA